MPPINLNEPTAFYIPNILHNASISFTKSYIIEERPYYSTLSLMRSHRVFLSDLF